MTIGAVIFDFGNVLVGWDPENLYRKLIPDAAERERRSYETSAARPGTWNRIAAAAGPRRSRF